MSVELAAQIECGQDERTSIYQSYCVFALLRKPPTSFSFSTEAVPSWGEIKPPTPVLLTVHFSAALKALVIGNLFKLFRLDITFAREVCHLGIKRKKIWQSSCSFHYPNGKVPVRMWWQIFQAWINYPIQGFSSQLKWIGWSTGVGGFICPQNGNPRL